MARWAPVLTLVALLLLFTTGLLQVQGREEGSRGSHSESSGHGHHSSSSDSDSDDGRCKTVLHQDTFSKPEDYDPANPNSKYFYFTNGLGFTADDGEIVTGPGGRVTHRAVPFKKTVPQGPGGTLDHTKALVYLKEFFTVGPNEILRYEATISARTFIKATLPFPDYAISDRDADIRLAGAAINGLDVNTWEVKDIIVAASGDYYVFFPFAERLPFGRSDFFGGPLGEYKAFSSCKRVVGKPVFTKIRVGTPVQLAIEYNRAEGSFSWFVRNRLVLKQTQIGFVPSDPDVNVILDHGGTPTPADPPSFQWGHGLFTLRDMSDPNNSTSTVGLAKLVTGVPGPNPFYVHPQKFTDPLSLEESRIDDTTGGELTIYKNRVCTRPANHKVSSSDDSDYNH